MNDTRLFVMTSTISQPTITITKPDTARRQLRTAIRLWFTGGDPVAIHTLAAASHEIIHRLFKLKGLHGLMFDWPAIKEEYRRDWVKHIKAPAAFFKHADRDPDATFDFNPERNWVIIMSCVIGLRKIDETHDLEESAFTWWLRIHHPDWFVMPGGSADDSIPIDIIEGLKGVEKDEFFQAFELNWRRLVQPRSPISR